jgi:hypothetical protein
MTLPILQGTYPAGDIYSHALASAYHHEWRILDPDFSQEKEPSVWELIQRDPVVQQAILQRLAVVAPKTWQVEAATKSDDDKRLARIVQEMLEGITRFVQARSDLAKAIFRGRAYAFISGRRRPFAFADSTTMQRWWLPHRLQPVDKRRIQFVPSRNAAGILTTRPQLFSVSREKWEDIRLKGNFVSVTYGGDEESRLGYGRGIIETLYFLWWARQRVMREGLQAVERWSQGFILAKIDSTVRPGGAGKDPNTMRDEMISMLEQHRAQHIAVVDKADDISVVTGPTGEHSLAEFWINYIDSKILGVSLGANLPFGGSADAGSLARSVEEGETADDRTELDRNVLDESVQADLVTCFLNRNRQQLEAEGLGNARIPRFATITQKTENPKENAETAAIVLQSAPLKREEYYARVGWEPPEDEDEVIEATAQPGLPGLPGLPDFGDTDLPPIDLDLPDDTTPTDEPANPDEPDPQIDDDAEVESELLGKVGGITGAIEILGKLGEGVITRETAVRLFVLFFHLTPEQASDLVGESGETLPEESIPDERSIAGEPPANNGGAPRAAVVG